MNDSSDDDQFNLLDSPFPSLGPKTLSPCIDPSHSHQHLDVVNFTKLGVPHPEEFL